MMNAMRCVCMTAGILVGTVASNVGAAGQRSFVASTGSDANPCTIAQPCRGFATAVANTNAGGEVIVLDSAGYGPVTITKSITIAAPPGIYAGISVFSGDGIKIDGAGIDVTLRGLSINGQGGDIGVHLTQAGTLVMENCEIAGMIDEGVLAFAANTKVLVRGSVLRNNGTSGLQATGTVTATLEGVAAFHNEIGVSATEGSRVSVTASTLASNGYAAMARSFGGVASMFVTHSTVADNGFGLDVKASAGNTASIVSDANAITFHPIAALQFQNNGGSEIIYTTGNNAVGYYGTGVAGGSLTPLNPL